MSSSPVFKIALRTCKVLSSFQFSYLKKKAPGVVATLRVALSRLAV